MAYTAISAALDFVESASCDKTGNDRPDYNPVAHSQYTFTVLNVSNFPLKYLSDSGKTLSKGPQ